MKTKLTLLLCLFVSISFAQEADQLDDLAFDIEMLQYQAYMDSINSTLNYETGIIQLRGGIASIDVPEGFKYLNSEQSNVVLVDIWGNPPSQEGEGTMGMLFQENATPFSDSVFAVNINYAAEGYVDDHDAKDIDYDELLSTMKEDVQAASEYRQEIGYESIELVDWASEPFYDSANKKLHWAKELKFGTAPTNTLNYSIRVLGRKGYLELNAIGEMYVLDLVKNNIDPVLQSVNFNEGYQYAEFDPKLDKVAAYGIGGLIAGKVLLKAGIIAKIGLMAAKFWKIIALAVVGFLAGIKRFFKKGDQVE